MLRGPLLSGISRRGAILQNPESTGSSPASRSGSSSTVRIRCREASARPRVVSYSASPGAMAGRISMVSGPRRGSSDSAGRTWREPRMATGTTGISLLRAAANAPERNASNPGSFWKVPSGKNPSDSPASAALTIWRASRVLPRTSLRSTNFEPERRNRKWAGAKLRISPLMTKLKRHGR